MQSSEFCFGILFFLERVGRRPSRQTLNTNRVLNMYEKGVYVDAACHQNAVAPTTGSHVIKSTTSSSPTVRPMPPLHLPPSDIKYGQTHTSRAP